MSGPVLAALFRFTLTGLVLRGLLLASLLLGIAASVPARGTESSAAQGKPAKVKQAGSS